MIFTLIANVDVDVIQTTKVQVEGEEGQSRQNANPASVKRTVSAFIIVTAALVRKFCMKSEFAALFSFDCWWT